MSDVLLDPPAIALCLRRIATEIIERGNVRALVDGTARQPPILVAVRRGGEALAKRIGALAVEAGSPALPFGVVDITLYRDDAATALANARIGPSHIPISVDGRRVVLVDDVLHTGRTIRAAVDAVLDYGRPSVIELAVLVDRGGRELPIQADYVGRTVDVPRGSRVEVMVKRTGPRQEDEEPWALIIPPAGEPNREAAPPAEEPR
ncbi:MAG: bifunctional pyr operon transcriptional regulator/uracil phosphoribosyltransferase PyrR [Polyangiaceae bacterium]|nr:bifunctional pyr operon transcriptional regulator/uracil phosphoribosyltransferase PyrR [Polyangiaceae bacterium]